ncbi:MAG: 23S rRNA (guanosine(2251)-2'-O)-methyltransferase RlmB [Acidiferrobacterales bacterium]
MALEKIFGIHAVLAAIEKNASSVDQIWLLKGQKNKKHPDIVKASELAGIRTNRVTRFELDKMVGRDAVHQGVVASIHGLPVGTDNDLMQLLEQLVDIPLLLVLDGVLDPHNLGACLRTADAAGVHGVILPKNRGVPVNATVRKVASGAAENVAIFEVSNLARTLNQLKQKGVWIIGTADKAESTLYDTDLSGPVAIIMGSEDKGLRRLTETECDQLASIPMAGSVTSLNVSAATAVCLYEANRQRSVGKYNGQ